MKNTSNALRRVMSVVLVFAMMFTLSLIHISLLAVLSLLVSATAFAASVPDPTSDFYVNDYVGVLSGDTKSDICLLYTSRCV